MGQVRCYQSSRVLGGAAGRARHSLCRRHAAFYRGVQELAERYAPHEADHIEPDDEELDAGSEEIGERFGPLLGLDSAAGGSVLNYEAVLKLDAETVLNKLTMEAARAAYQRRYQKIIHNKKD